jgi:threonine aldolase
MHAPIAHRPRHFASDNNSGICPEVWSALAEANMGHATGYGDDPWTARASDLIREWFETDCSVFFVFNGTAANALALSSICRPYHAVLCHRSAHVQLDECAAPEFFTGGAKLLPLSGDHGKLTPDVVEVTIRDHFPLHSSKPAALSLTQSTECGTVYTGAEIAALSEVAHNHRLRTHLDGARFANAVASLDVAPKSITWQAGIDILSLGATKNGGLTSEAIVVFQPDLAHELEYRIKQAGQLASKMRYSAAAWIGLLGTGAWLRNALHANRMATRLTTGLKALPGIRFLHPTQANGVFVDLPAHAIPQLHQLGWHFYVFEGETGCRLMCSWDTQASDIDAFIADLGSLLQPTSASAKPKARTKPQGRRLTGQRRRR